MPDAASAAAAGDFRLGDRVVRRMGFGSMRLTADPSRDRAIDVLRTAVELGVNHIDTAAFYQSPGGVLGVSGGPVRHAAELIRAALAPYPADLVIATKVGPWSPPGTLRSEVEDNLRLLGVDALDVVNLRVTRRADPIGDRFTELAQMRDEGLIRHLGLSNVTPAHLAEAEPIAPVVCVQNAWGVDYRRDAGDEMVALCAGREIAFVPFFALAGAGREAGREAGPSGAHDAAVRAVAADLGATPAQVCLAWTLQYAPHVLAIPGTGDVAHLRENVAAAALRLTAEQMAALG